MVHLARPAHVGDVHHAVDALLELDEGPVGRHVADLAAHARPDRVIVADHVPWVGLQLAQAERDLLLLLLDAEDDRVELLADLEQLGGLRDALCPGHLGDVHEALDARLDLDEGPIGHEVDHLAADLGADRELAVDLVPGILGGLLEAERNAFLLAVHLDDHDLDLLALLQHLARMRDPAPAHVGDVEQAVHAVQVDECAEVGDVLDDALAELPGLDRVEERAALLGALLLDQLAPGKDDVLPVEVDLEDLEVVRLADILVQVLGRLHVDVRRRHERVDPDRDDEAALDLGLHPARCH